MVMACIVVIIWCVGAHVVDFNMSVVIELLFFVDEFACIWVVSLAFFCRVDVFDVFPLVRADLPRTWLINMREYRWCSTKDKYHIGGKSARHVGHYNFTYNHCLKHSSWNLWLQGVFITVASFNKASVKIEVEGLIDSVSACSKMFCRQIVH